MYYLKPSSEKGVAQVAVLIAAVALIGFILVSSSAEFKSKLFSQLFPNKPQSHAADLGSTSAGGFSFTLSNIFPKV